MGRVWVVEGAVRVSPVGGVVVVMLWWRVSAFVRDVMVGCVAARKACSASRCEVKWTPVNPATGVQRHC